jgi:hypothetical protein
LVLIAAVVLQCSPLRTCELAGIVVGHSCHDGAGGHAVDAGSGDENTCACNGPKGMENQGKVVVAAADFTPFVGGPVGVVEPVVLVGVRGEVAGGDGAVAGPNPPQRTPLLI